MLTRVVTTLAVISGTRMTARSMTGGRSIRRQPGRRARCVNSALASVPILITGTARHPWSQWSSIGWSPWLLLSCATLIARTEASREVHRLALVPHSKQLRRAAAAFAHAGQLFQQVGCENPGPESLLLQSSS